MQYQDPPVKERSERLEDPERNSVAEPGPDGPRSYHHIYP